MKHFEYTGKTKEFFGVMLRQIRYITDMPQHNIKTGDIGGWIEKDENLCGNACVCGDARVHGNACVSGGEWRKSPLYIQGTRWAACMCTDNLLKIGCQKHTLEDWQKNYLNIAKENDAEDIAEEYKLYIDLACARYLGQEDKNETDSI